MSPAFLRRIRFAAVGSIWLLPLTSIAHHAEGYSRPETISAGLLSGLAHPVIGVAHLAFLIALGLLCTRSAAGSRMVLTFAAGSLTGALAAASGFAWPSDELLAALTVLGAGVLLALPAMRVSPVVTAICLVMAGSVHGQIAAEASGGAEGVVLAAYWTGLVAMQVALAYAAFLTARQLGRLKRIDLPQLQRVAAAGVIAAGLLVAVRPGLSIL